MIISKERRRRVNDLKYKLYCIDRFVRVFHKGTYTFNIWYDQWVIEDEKNKLVACHSITSTCFLSSFLRSLLAHRDSYLLTEKQVKLLKKMFQHTNHWKCFKEAKRILTEKGSKEALKYLEEKFTIIYLGDKLSGK